MATVKWSDHALECMREQIRYIARTGGLAPNDITGETRPSYP